MKKLIVLLSQWAPCLTPNKGFHWKEWLPRKEMHRGLGVWPDGERFWSFDPFAMLKITFRKYVEHRLKSKLNLVCMYLKRIEWLHKNCYLVGGIKIWWGGRILWWRNEQNNETNNDSRKNTLHEKRPNTKFFLVPIFPYLDWIRRFTP